MYSDKVEKRSILTLDNYTVQRASSETPVTFKQTLQATMCLMFVAELQTVTH